MQMLRTENLISGKVREILPDSYKGCPYVKIKVGDKITIKEVVYSVYPVIEKDKDGKPVYGDDGLVVWKTNGKNEPVLNTTAYLRLDDDTMTSVKYRTALNQLYSITGEPKREIGTYPFTLDLDGDEINCTVKVIPYKDTYGKREHDTIAFEPIE